MTEVRRPAARAASAISPHTVMDSAVVMFWLAWENVSVQTTTTFTSSTAAATARSNPLALSTSPM